MAHKKGASSSKNGRDSKPKRRGVKIYGGQAVKQSGIIVVQCGTKFAPGRFVRRASNDFLYATTAGKVYFDQGGKRVNVLPDDAASVLV
ncbi:50S ribosomal protein L27 [bacterium]|nr:50S ribosomal protein L27 [bacterium]